MITPAMLRAALQDAPLALHPAAARPYLAELAAAADAPPPPAHIAAYGLSPGAETQRAYEVVDGIAIIPVHGILVQQLGTAYSWGWATGYDGLRLNLAQALVDAEVAAIVLHVDSPGGQVAGCFDLVDAIHAARGAKPMVAILAENAYSAAYAIASACDRITVPRTGGTGSIGVIALLMEFSRMLDEAGITVHILQHGARKSDGNPYQPIPEAATKRFQAQIDTMGELFIATVARNRSLDPAAIRAMEATTFMGEEGVAAGLTDAVMAPDIAFDGLRAAVA